MKTTNSSPAWPVTIALLLLFLLQACATPERARPVVSRYADILNLYPQTGEPLQIPKLPVTANDPKLRKHDNGDVFIIVHPAYGVFVKDLSISKEKYPDVKYYLMKRQFLNEAKFVASESLTDNIIILIVPGKYDKESTYPLSYTNYLNSMTWGSHSVYYVYSESPNSGIISTDDLINLYRFLKEIKAKRILVGGGYIGRCQREFFNQLTAYVDTTPTYIVPEISTISPEDISSEEASKILNSLLSSDFGPVRSFIDRKVGSYNLLPLPTADKPVFR